MGWKNFHTKTGNRNWDEVFTSLFFLSLILRKKCCKLLKKKWFDIFLIWEHDEEWLKVFIGRVNMFHPTVNFIAEYSKEEFNLLYLNIKLVDGDIKILLQLLHILITAKKEQLTVQYQGLIGFV